MPKKFLDENDQLKAGVLPDDAFEDAEPFFDPPTDSDGDSPVPPPSRDVGTQAGAEVIDLDAMGIGALATGVISRMKARATKKETPIPVPWPGLAKALGGGLWAQQVSVLVSNTAVGKTQCGFQLADYAAARGVPTLYIGLELGPLDAVARLLGLRAKVKWSGLYLGNLDPAKLDAIVAEQMAKLVEAPLFLSFAPPHGWKHTSLEPLVAAMRSRFPEVAGADGKPIAGSKPILVVLDFLQLVSGDERELRERIGKAAYAARAVSMKYDAALLLVSSTARENYATLAGDAKKDSDKKNIGMGNPARFIGLGKESGEIEFAANNVLILQREPWPGDLPPPNGTITHLGIAKVRARAEGAPSWVTLTFDGSRFDEVKGGANGVAAAVSDADDSGAPPPGDDDVGYPF